MKNDLLDGKYTRFYPNGKIDYECEYSKGKKNGYFKKYTRNGIIEYECKYIKNKKHNEYKDCVL